MTPQWVVEFIKSLDKKHLYKFYKLDEWLELRDAVLQFYHYECQDCKAKGKYKPAQMVHHNQWVKSHPETALDFYYIDNKGERKINLVALCNDCHNKRHPEKFKHLKDAQTQRHQKKQLNQERW